MPPTPLQNSYASFEEEQRHVEVEDQMWSARDRAIIAKTKDHLDESWKKYGTKKAAIFETFSTDGPSAFVVVSRSERQWQDGLEGQRVGWTPLERMVVEAAENYLETCVHTNMDIEALERLMEPENEEVSLRCILRCSFPVFLTQQRKRTTSWQAEDEGWRVREGRQHSKKVGKMSGMILSITERWRKPLRAPKGPENAVAAARFAIIQGQRRSVDLSGRQAQAASRFRGDGQENAETPRRH